MSLQSLDARLLLWINHGTANNLFDALMPLLSTRGYLLIFPFLAYLVLKAGSLRDNCGRSWLVHAVWTVAVACVAAVPAEYSEYFLKDAVGRMRPCRVIDGLRVIVPCPKSYTMPSGHAISSFAAITPLMYLTRAWLHTGWRWYPLCLASLIAFSRLYLGLHYLSDILAGALLGSLISLLLCLAYEKIELRVRT